MQIKKGIPVSPGVAISRALVLDAEDQPIPRRTVAQAQVANELRRFDQALGESGKVIEHLRDQATATVGPEYAKIFTFHLGMLKDKQFLGDVRQLITRDHFTAEYAVYSVMHDLAKRFKSLDNRYFREREADIWDLQRRIVNHLIGEHPRGLEPDQGRGGSSSPTISRRAKPPRWTGPRSRESPPTRAAGPVIRRSWPMPWASPRSSGWRT